MTPREPALLSVSLDSKPTKRRSAPSALSVAPPIVHRVLSAPAAPLDPALRRDAERRFDFDFSRVRIHADAEAAQSAQAVHSLAYAAGSHIVFGQGRYQPDTASGRRLLVHELAHVVQQRGADISPSLPVTDVSAPAEVEAEAVARDPGRPVSTNAAAAVARAVVQMGNVSAHIDYGDIYAIPAAGYDAAIASRYRAYAGVALNPVLSTQIGGFASSAKQWLLFALDILSENTSQAPALGKATAFQRLVDRAPTATTRPLGAAVLAFAREVLTVSGWAERAISGGLAAPAAADLTVIDPLLNPPASASAPPGGALDLPTLQAELPVRTLARLNLSAADPARWPGVRAQPLAQIQSVGDVIQAEARSFFSPYADTARGNSWLSGRQYSANIDSVTTDAAGAPAVVTPADRMSLLRNRATIAGQSTESGDSLFSRTNFDADRDDTAFVAILNTMLTSASTRDMLDRQFRHTGHLERPSLRVAISTEVNSAIPECATRWGTVRTLCHELMHSLAHPEFVAAIDSSTRFPNGVNFDQVLREGFAEVLGVQLFNALRLRAVTETTLRDNLTRGVTGPCQPPSTAAVPGYGGAGTNAEAIRSRVSDNRFRAAYFHGRVSLVGL